MNPTWIATATRTLLRWLLPAGEGDALIGDLEEAYGPAPGASWRYVHEAASALWHFHTRNLTRAAAAQATLAGAGSYAAVLAGGCAAATLAAPFITPPATPGEQLPVVGGFFLAGAGVAAMLSGYVARRVLAPAALTSGFGLITVGIAWPVCLVSLLALSPTSALVIAWVPLIPTCLVVGGRIGERRTTAP